MKTSKSDNLQVCDLELFPMASESCSLALRFADGSLTWPICSCLYIQNCFVIRGQAFWKRLNIRRKLKSRLWIDFFLPNSMPHLLVLCLELFLVGFHELFSRSSRGRRLDDKVGLVYCHNLEALNDLFGDCISCTPHVGLRTKGNTNSPNELFEGLYLQDVHWTLLCWLFVGLWFVCHQDGLVFCSCLEMLNHFFGDYTSFTQHTCLRKHSGVRSRHGRGFTLIAAL